jgi:threonine aldolase
VKRARHFASDNNSGICPEAWAALEEANHGHASGYGADPWTKKACRLVRDLFETDCEVFFVFTGSAANALGLASVCRSYHSIICHEASHVQNDECGAPEFFTGGAKVRPIPGKDGRLTPESIAAVADARTDLHFPKSGALSLTQSTELGTVYSPAQLKAICRTAKKSGLKIHMDGARFANAVASLGVAPKDISWKVGVDMLSFGLTKNGTHAGEALIFFDKSLAREFDWQNKQAGQLASKMRFLAAPWVGMLQDGAWLRHSNHANKMAKRLRRALAKISGIKFLHPTQANAVFVDMRPVLVNALHKRGWHFYTLYGDNDARLMCSWDTTQEDIDDFVADLSNLMFKRKKLRPNTRKGQGRKPN